MRRALLATIAGGLALAALIAPAMAQDTSATPANASGLTDACTGSGHGTRNISVQDATTGNDREWKVSITTGGGCSLDLHSRGELTFARDLGDVERITPHGYLELTERDGDLVRRFEAHPLADGTLERTWTVSGERRPFDADARRRLAAMLVALDRHTGFAAPIRVPALLRDGGVDAVLREITRMSGDYARRVYFVTLLDSARIGENDAARIMHQAGTEIDSDYELATLLITMGERDLVTARTAPAYVEATRSLQSDYEHRRALAAVLEHPTLAAPVAGAILRSASTIGSDYEMASLLVGMSRAHLIADSLREPFFAAVKHIGSDYEHRRVLTALLDSDSVSQAMIADVLASAAGIGSDYERATVLVTVANRFALDDRLRDAYVKAANAIGSDYERRRALTALLKRTSI